jgi:serine/threonine-protein kinase
VTAPLERLTAALADRYRLERELGQGGMATVYLAHDVKHDRKVALKVLRPELAAVIGAERFLAEIKTTANLQHPHILPLFDSGEADSFLFYVMPYIEGETVRDRLTREKQLPIVEAVRIAIEVAAALDYAHRRGVIHRDIKPDNILLHDGSALVADFGIALAASRAGGSRMTETGMSLGTPHYMSPEQAMGEREITARSDVYALGCVLYEMLLGEPPFTGPTAQAIVARVMTEKPAPIASRRDRVPPQVEDAVLTALEKLPADRFGTAGEFGAALAAASAAPRATGVRTTAGATERAGHGRRWQIVAGVLAALVLGLTAALVVVSRRTPEPRAIRVEMQPGTSSGPYPMRIAGAPDGRSYAYCTSAGAVAIRRWEDLAPTPVPGLTSGCAAVAYSPDGASLAIIGIPTALSILPLESGALPRQLPVGGLDDVAVYGGGLDWGSDDHLYLTGRNGLSRISPLDGSAERVAVADTALAFYGVDVLPGARHAVVVTAPADDPDLQVGIMDLRAGTIAPITPGVVGRYADPGHLLVVRRDGTIIGVPVDPRTRRPRGPPVMLPDSLGIGRADQSPATTAVFWQGLIDVGADGTLLYWRSVLSGESRPVLVDRQGVERPLPDAWTGLNLIPRLSPDGSRLALELNEVGMSRTVVRSLASGATRVIGATGALTGRGVWTPDGLGLTLISDRHGTARPYAWRLADDVTEPLPRYDPRPVFAAEWSRDGRWLLLRTDDQAPGRADILAVRPGIDSVARPVLAMPEISEYTPMLSPDARWLAYVSNEDGRYEVRVTSFPDARERWRISTAGGSAPAWSHDGRELFYVADDGYLMAATVEPGAEFSVAAQQRLFSVATYALYGFFNRNYDVARDGTFLMLRQSGNVSSGLVAVHHWAASLRGRTGR